MKRREWKSSPERTRVETRNGTFLVLANGKDSLYVQTDDDGVDIRGVGVRGEEHWHRQKDGTWKNYHATTSRFPFVAKRTDRGFLDNDATPHQSKTLLSYMQAAVEEFVANHERALWVGEAISANNDMHRTEGQIEELQKKMNELLNERDAALAREAAALRRLEAMPEDDEVLSMVGPGR